ncbi:MAG: hypothetical protein WCF65_03480 [Parachlamydiaceae bacterium]
MLKILSMLVKGALLSAPLIASETLPLAEHAFHQGAFTYGSSPIPQGMLDPQLLDEFMPFIRAEITREFTHQEDSRTHRDTLHYGFNFFKMLSGDFSYDSPPEFLQHLGTHICYAFGHEPPAEFTNIILSVYDKGFYLEPHVDVSIKDLYGNAPFYFGERVYGIVIEPDPTGHLYFSKWEGGGLVPPLDIESIYSVEEQAGTIFCLEGDFRQTPYFHAVSPVSNHRISITFRTVEKVDR